ncbi:MAG: hypothetical protein ACI9IP_001322 [Arcticibacterium sp.]|jgi:hypothetical protein
MAFNVPKGERKVPFWSRMASKLNIFDWIEEKLNITEELPTGMLRKVGFAFFLVIIYIYFQHNFDNLIRRLDKTESEIKEKRAAYISHKSSYMFESKHSQVSKALDSRGLNRNIEPPIKIVTEQ